jgi:predicted glycosyltransferase involved in capsule biosynthesis
MYGMNIVLHQGSGNPFDGSFGRISVWRDNFINIGGYDETFEPVGYQDENLMKRLEKGCGCQYFQVKDRRYNKAIYNTKEENIVHTNSQYHTWMEMDHHNYRISQNNLLNEQFVTNNRVFGIQKTYLK